MPRAQPGCCFRTSVNVSCTSIECVMYCKYHFQGVLTSFKRDQGDQGSDNTILHMYRCFDTVFLSGILQNLLFQIIHAQPQTGAHQLIPHPQATHLGPPQILVPKLLHPGTIVQLPPTGAAATYLMNPQD